MIFLASLFHQIGFSEPYLEGELCMDNSSNEEIPDKTEPDKHDDNDGKRTNTSHQEIAITFINKRGKETTRVIYTKKYGLMTRRLYHIAICEGYEIKFKSEDDIVVSSKPNWRKS